MHAAARHYLRALGARVVAERYVPRGAVDPQPLLDAIAAGRADAVLLTLIGRDLVVFNRAFASSPLAERVLRLCPALEGERPAGHRWRRQRGALRHDGVLRLGRHRVEPGVPYDGVHERLRAAAADHMAHR